MEKIKLNIIRDKSFVGAAMPYRITINGIEVAKLAIGKSFSCEIQNAPSTLKVAMVGNSLTFHKIEKEIVLFPEYSNLGIINCRITTKFSWMGFLTLGLFQAVGKIEINVEHK